MREAAECSRAYHFSTRLHGCRIRELKFVGNVTGCFCTAWSPVATEQFSTNRPIFLEHPTPSHRHKFSHHSLFEESTPRDALRGGERRADVGERTNHFAFSAFIRVVSVALIPVEPPRDQRFSKSPGIIGRNHQFTLSGRFDSIDWMKRGE